MVLAKTSKSAARISTQFRDRLVTKYYTAICLGRLKKPSDSLAHSLVRDPSNLTRPAADREKGVDCLLHYEVIEAGTIDNVAVSKLKIKLVTGFKHQIRAQLATVGHPIYGDIKYGAPITSRFDEAIGLFSSFLSFTHPIERNLLEFSCSMDGSWPFANFMPN
jgi:23S rRNA pseudouridine1911/1915/1917 synthase